MAGADLPRGCRGRRGLVRGLGLSISAVVLLVGLLPSAAADDPQWHNHGDNDVPVFMCLTDTTYSSPVVRPDRRRNQRPLLLAARAALHPPSRRCRRRARTRYLSAGSMARGLRPSWAALCGTRCSDRRLLWCAIGSRRRRPCPTACPGVLTGCRTSRRQSYGVSHSMSCTRGRGHAGVSHRRPDHPLGCLLAHVAPRARRRSVPGTRLLLVQRGGGRRGV